MTLHRVVHDRTNPYTIINTTIVRDARISAKAKALWLYAFSRPDDWQFYSSEIEMHFKEGRDAIRSGLNELEEFGYLKREQQRQADGKMGTMCWVWYEVPQIILPQPENPTAAKTGPAKPQLLSTDSTSEDNTYPYGSIGAEAPARASSPCRRGEKKERAPNVHTTDDEHQRLIDELGQETVAACYRELSEWKEDKPKNRWRKDDNRSIRRWVIAAIKERKQRGKAAPEERGGTRDKWNKYLRENGK